MKKNRQLHDQDNRQNPKTRCHRRWLKIRKDGSFTVLIVSGSMPLSRSDSCSSWVRSIPFTPAEEKLKEENENKLNEVVSQSFICINLKKIVTDLFFKEGQKRNDNLTIDFLHPKERIIITQIRERNAKEIIIRFNDENEPTHINVKKNRISEEIINKVARYLKKGNYQKIEFKTRDGELITYDETDIIKL